MKIIPVEGMGPIYQLDSRPIFPPPSLANEAGLLAVGGDLSLPRLLEAYRHGIFPWYEPGEPILWWSPDPRLILDPAELRVSRSLRSVLRKGEFEVRFDTACTQVIHACATSPRPDQNGTWIGRDIEAAYTALHHAGVCHSVEAWSGGTLVGGLYGVCLGGCFFGESMFSARSNASKVALVRLAELLLALGIDVIDCQVASEHLISLGAKEIARAEFLERIYRAPAHSVVAGRWTDLAAAFGGTGG